MLLGGLHLHELLLLRSDLCEITRIPASRPGPSPDMAGSVSLVDMHATNMNRQVMLATKYEAMQ